MSLSTLRGARPTQAHGSKRNHIKVPIPLERPKEKKYQKTELLKFKLKNNPTQADSGEYTFTIPFFSTGTAEQTINLRLNIKKIFTGLNMNTGPAQFQIVRRILKGDALSAFNGYATDRGAETVATMRACLRDLLTHIIPPRGLIYQKRAMRQLCESRQKCLCESLWHGLRRLTVICSIFRLSMPTQAFPMTS